MTIKKLSNMDRAELELEALFVGKLWCFTTVLRGSFVGLGVAVANEPGYSPVPLSRCHSDDYHAMEAHADELNQQWLGLDRMTAMRVLCSSMAAGSVKPSADADAMVAA